MNWDIAGGIIHKDTVINYITNNDFTYASLSVFDAPCNIKWVGGRIVNNSKHIKNETELTSIANEYKNRGIGVNLCFSNHLLELEHLDDVFGNSVLEIFHDSSNSVIVCSGVLDEHIRTNYPDYKITHSIVQSYIDDVIFKSDSEIVTYLNNKLTTYDMLVLPSELNKRFDILEQLTDLDQIKIIVNDLCISNCMDRVDHHTYTAEINMSDEKEWDTSTYVMNVFCDSTKPMTEMALTLQDIRQLSDFGISNFKLLERSSTSISLLDSMEEYLIEY